jgi:thiol:disulfide interchange protein DsbD
MELFLSHIDTLLQTSLLSSLVVAYVGGVLASLTPCVYPMIPITAGVIGHANIGGSKLRGFILSLTYVTGMALTYATLGIFAAATGRFFGTVSSSPWTLLLVGNIILLFGLGMLGVFHLPSMNAGRFSSQRLGIVGIFLAGVTSALVAGPCTTPVLGTLLAYTASSHSLAVGGLLLFVFSLGMGALLLGVGTFSGFLTTLPRSGAWMIKIQKIMGVLMLLLAEYFILKAGAFFF